ncbi:hypothetical protein [Ramlibacter albus]|uniref:Uncharacterized protein n=1 Tax=Ramlibacter albus TaxID=2079448 RepID=A0A923S4Y4_9BURK|nr:hypothetical protein [Ramlibacter albus]MBC5768005.1 hypothetical protein [Ramlibacter albus]
MQDTLDHPPVARGEFALEIEDKKARLQQLEQQRLRVVADSRNSMAEFRLESQRMADAIQLARQRLERCRGSGG